MLLIQWKICSRVKTWAFNQVGGIYLLLNFCDIQLTGYPSIVYEYESYVCSEMLKVQLF